VDLPDAAVSARPEPQEGARDEAAEEDAEHAGRSIGLSRASWPTLRVIRGC
jgi:hypothetical protein